jgi:hypothetical protein
LDFYIVHFARQSAATLPLPEGAGLMNDKPPTTNDTNLPVTNLQRGHLGRLRAISARLRTAATFKRGSDSTRQGETGAQKYEDDAAAIDWALRQLSPAETERQQAAHLFAPPP